MPMSLKLVPFALMALLSGPLAAVSRPPAEDAATVIFVLPPWIERDAFLSATGARDIGPLQAPFSVLAALGPDTTAADARAAGAWAVLDGTLIARLCGAA